jgi:anti-anti-sigma factor
MIIEERIYFGLADDSLTITPVGHITADLCPALKERIQPYLFPEPRIRSVRLDLSGCDYMDSTFLGLIVYFSKTLKNAGLAAPFVHQAGEECMSLFRTMGMMKMLSFSDKPCPKPAQSDAVLTRADLTASFLLEAHRELTMLSPENEERFRALTNALEDSSNQ